MASIKEYEDLFLKADQAAQEATDPAARQQAEADARMFLGEIDRLKAAAAKPVSTATRYDVQGAPFARMTSPGVGTMLREGGTTAGATTAGQMIGTAVAPGVGTVVGGMVGGGVGNLVNQLQRMAEDPEYKFQWGEFMTDVGTGGVPGAALASTGRKAVFQQARRQGLTTLGGAELQSLVDRGELLSPEQAATSLVLGGAGGAVAQKMQAGSKGVQAAVGEQMAGRGQKSLVTDTGAEIGLKAPPTEILKESGGGGFTTKQVSSMAGREALDFETRLQNQQAVNKAVKQQLGIPEKTDTTVEVLRGVRDKAGEVYDEVGKIGAAGKKAVEDIDELRKQMTRTSDPAERAILEERFDKAFASSKRTAETRAAADVEELRRLRGESRRARDKYYQSEGKLPEELEKSMLAREQAQALEVQIEEAVRSAGNPTLADKLKKAREKIAQSYDAEDALNVGTGDFDARVFGRKLNQGRPLSGNLKAIGEFQQAYKGAFGDPGATRVAGVSKLGTVGKLLAGGATYTATQNVPAAVVTAFAPEIAGEASRKYLLSKGAQETAREAIRPRLTRGAPLASVATRQVAQEAGETMSEGPVVTRDAVDFLIKNPETAKDFDAKYGEGLAARFLKANRR